MKPKLLKIKGLNSYMENQEINFEKLTEGGLFGIFGPTGSGKSTILDAITIALYGKIARATDLSGIINTQTDLVSLTYVFELGDGSQRITYQVERSFKRDKSGGVKSRLVRLCNVSNPEQVEIIAEGRNSVDNKVQAILGLTVKDFTRSVVLPQGSFSEFLQLPRAERRNMLERIFSLEQYGRFFIDKLRQFKKQQYYRLTEIQGALRSYEAISHEVLEQLKQSMQRLHQQEEHVKQELNQLEDKYEKYKVIWDLQTELHGYRIKETELNTHKESFEQLTINLQKAEQAYLVKPYIDRRLITLERLKDVENQLTPLKLEYLNESRQLPKLEQARTQAILKRDQELPVKIEKRKDLETALEYEGQIEELSLERQQLACQYQALDKMIKKTKEEVQNLSTKQQTEIQDLARILDRINKITISSEFRENVNQGYAVEREYSQLVETVEELKQRLTNIASNTSNLDKQLKDSRDKLKLETEKLESLIDEKLQLENNCPGSQKILIDEQSIIERKKLEIDEVKVIFEETALVKQRLIDLEEEKQKFVQKLFEQTTIVNTFQQEEDSLKAEIKVLEEQQMAGRLAEHLTEQVPCPVCGSVHHPNLATKGNEIRLSEKQKLLNELQAKLEQQRGIKGNIEIQIAVQSSNINQLQDKLTQLNQQLDGRNVEELEQGLAAVIEHNLRLTEKINLWESRVKELDQLAASAKDTVSELKAEQAAFEMATKKESDYYQEVKNKFIKDRERLNALQSEYVKFQQLLGVDKIEKKMSEVIRFDKEREGLVAQEKQLRQAQEQTELAIKQKTDGLKHYEVDLARIVESGKEKAKFLEEKTIAKNKLSDGKNIKAYLEIMNKEINEIKSEAERLAQEYEQKQMVIQQVENQLTSMQEKYNGLELNAKEQSQELCLMLKEQGFESEEQVLKVYLNKDKIHELKIKINTYEDEVKRNKDNISRIESRLGQDRIDTEAWQLLQDNRIAKQNQYQQIIKLITEQQTKRCELEKGLEAQKQLLEEKKKLEHKLSLVDDMDKLVQGNRFVEFVATSQLKYITKEASVLLLDITRGRYSLELDEDTNFIMRDHFNGGATRATNTLSGGETFLTSLALALALSSHIQLRGSAPLEFFFLDEGFGSLDSELLETVMTSLERLMEKNLTVGIISHVDELKQRVPRKLVVKPAISGVRGTKVEIELS